MHSGNEQMRAILEVALDMGLPLVSVKVPREANLDADRLSHPDQLGEVLEDATGTGFHVVVLHPNEEDWAALVRAIDQPPATRPRKRSRPRPS